MARPKAGEFTKTQAIKEGISKFPDMGNTELAEKLNQIYKNEIAGGKPFDPVVIGGVRSALKKKAQAESGMVSSPVAPVASPGAGTGADPLDAIGHQMRQAKELLDSVGGKDRLLKLIALIETAQQL